MAHSKLRQLPRISYFEPEDPSFDEYIYCSGCRDYVYDMCPQHGPLLILPDTKVPEKTNYPSYVPRAALTIPKAFLHIARSYIPGAGLGVFSSVTLPNGLRFGPYRGVVKKNPDSSYCWQIFDKNNKPSHVVDGGDGHRSNWMRFINCSRNWNEQNLIAFQYKRQIYYRTIKIIPRNTELLVYYGSEAAHGLGIDLRFYNCQPQITEPTFTASENVKDKNLDKDHEPKIGINDNLKAEITGMNTKTNIAFHQREKVKESSILSVDSKSKSAIEVNKNIKKSVSSTQSKFIRHQNEPTSSTIENVKHSSDLCKDRKLQDHKTKKPFEINNTPKTTKNFTCDQCGKFFSNKKLLKEHIIEENKIIHHIKNTNNQKISYVNDFFYCDICEFKTKEKRFIESHLKVHAAKRVYTCHVCGYRSIREIMLKRHLRTHTGEKTYSCHLCEYICTRKGHLKQHMRTHTGEKPYSCHLCEYKCTVNGSLKIHMRTHTGEKPYSCHLCEYKCTLKGYLKLHLRTHTGEKPYSCHLCEYKCTVNSNLKTHMRTHTGEKPYSCHLCEYKCTQKGDLKLHLRTHTGEKPYLCHLCEYKCTRKGVLKLHLRTHTGEKPYSCHLCEYKCTVNGSLKIHMRTHTGEKPYSCHLCEYKCRDNSNLKRHMRTHTGEKPFH